MSKSLRSISLSFLSLSFFSILILMLTLWAPTASAYSTYSTDGSTGNCAACHGDFNSGTYNSNSGDGTWGTDLMSGHQDAFSVPSGCGGCHKDRGFSPVYLNPASDPDGDSAGLGCVGCHGRTQDSTRTIV